MRELAGQRHRRPKAGAKRNGHLAGTSTQLDGSIVTQAVVPPLEPFKVKDAEDFVFEVTQPAQ
jgi:hypothetical protein